MMYLFFCLMCEFYINDNKKNLVLELKYVI